MTSPYRNEIDALRERKASLEREIARLREQTNELEGLRARQEELARELSFVDKKLGDGGARRSLPLLDQVRVASPCNASWDEMLGDDRVRFCLSCEKNVYNLSAMPREEAERLLQERLGGELCVRFYQRADGTLLTADCPVGVQKKRRKKVALAVAAAGATALAAVQMLARGPACRTGSVAVQGEIEPRATMGEAVDPGEWTMGDRAAPTPSVMGTVAPPTAPQAPTTGVRPEPKSHPPAVMGRRVR